MNAAKARDIFADIIGQVCYAKERITVTRRRKTVATMVPIEDLKLFRAIEDKMALEEVRKALAKPGGNIPWE